MKIRPLAANLSHTGIRRDRQTDGQKWRN